MKVLNPTTTIIMPSHMKPRTLPTSIESVLAQTRRDFVLVIIDSGEWVGPPMLGDITGDHTMPAIRDTYADHPLVEWYSLGEPPGLINRRCPIAYIPNLAARTGLVRGQYAAFMTDDDIYHPTYIERMTGYLDDHPDDHAVYCSQDRVRIVGDTIEPATPTLIADRPRGPGEFECEVDLLQMVVRSWVPQHVTFDEDPMDGQCRRADGRWMDAVAALGAVPNIPDVLVTHRYGPDETYG